MAAKTDSESFIKMYDNVKSISFAKVVKTDAFIR